MTTRSANRVLIANRGEIALRVVRTVRDLGGTSILPYTPEDLLSPAAELADEAHALPEGSSYTDAAAILDLARRTGADAIHPGYGFLSERADFARAVMDADITWVGPSPEAMEALGDKMSARATAERAGVAPVPGITDSVTGPDAVIDFASAHGYPVALKRTDGGGGRGITVLASEEEVRSTPAFEAAAAGGGALILEKFVTAARHIETQCARDGHGAFAVVSTRDCTLQRRNQKLLEEAPAPYLPEGLDARLTGASRRLLEAVDYVGVATCEFLLTPDGDLWFLEVNPRLQVEHCVSEEVTGVDLVEIQLRIAVGGRLGEIPAPRGHSVELRITCEDPARSLAPSTGAITRLRWPAGPGVRIESGVVEGDVVTPVFDPMLAKIVVTGADRDQALRRARRALHETVVEGVTVCTALHEHVLGREEFTAADPRGGLGVTTRWIETEFADDLQASVRPAPLGTMSLLRMPVELDGRRVMLGLPEQLLGALAVMGQAMPQDGSAAGGALGQAGAASGAGAPMAAVQAGEIAAPMAGTLLAWKAEEGETVAEGQLVAVMEAMKMEMQVTAPCAGTLHRGASAGQVLAAAEVLGRIA